LADAQLIKNLSQCILRVFAIMAAQIKYLTTV
jgi:hypothetical protein